MWLWAGGWNTQCFSLTNQWTGRRSSCDGQLVTERVLSLINAAWFLSHWSTDIKIIRKEHVWPLNSCLFTFYFNIHTLTHPYGTLPRLCCREVGRKPENPEEPEELYCTRKPVHKDDKDLKSSVLETVGVSYHASAYLSDTAVRTFIYLRRTFPSEVRVTS